VSAALSLRRRLQVGLIFAIGALAVAIYVITKVAGESDAARASAARSTASTIARALRATSPRDADAARLAVGAVGDASAGFCTRDGALDAFAGNGPRGEPVDRPPPPDLADAIRALCRSSGEQQRDTAIRHPRDIAAVVVSDVDHDSSAWAVVRMQRPDGSRGAWLWPVGILAIAIVALAINTLDVLRALRAGIGQLGAALVVLERDLGSSIERPRADELGRIADGLEQMAARLASARSRERGLETRLAHEQRLSALGRVVAGVAHEVRNPLAGIKLRLDVVLRSSIAPPGVVDDVRAALDEVARLDRLVTALLSVARRSTGAEPLALAPLIDERLALLAGWAGERHIELRRRGDARIIGDRDAVSRAIDNLVRNAVEVSPTGDVVDVAIEQRDDGAVVDVVDRGPGVADGVELFEPFSTSKVDGVGLGTFIARSLIGAIGGSITYVREEPWTRMRISLPTS
jgi:signal transduction histidine kinase